GENNQVREDQSIDRIFRRLQPGPSSDPVQKARSATTRWRSAMVERARNSRTHPRRTVLQATDGDYPAARHAITRTLHQVAATLRYRPRLERRIPGSPALSASQELRPQKASSLFHRGRECDEPKLAALRALGSWRESPRL